MRALLLISFFILTCCPAKANNSQQEDHIILIGYIEEEEALLKLQVFEPGEYHVVYWEKNNPDKIKKKLITAGVGDTLPVKVKLKDLHENSAYTVKVLFNGRDLTLGNPVSFKTPSITSKGKKAIDFSFLTGSCLYLNDKYDDETNPYGQPTDILATMNTIESDFMLWLGDNLYYRPKDCTSHYRMNKRYIMTRRNPDIARLLATRANYAIWDDHDYGPDDSNKKFELRDTSLALFQRYWANKEYGKEKVPGVFSKFRWADCEFFLMDDRFYRTEDTIPSMIDSLPNRNKRFYGSEQLNWLLDNLKESKATFKFIVSGNQMINPRAEKECFTKYAYEYGKMMNWIKSEKIEGIIFLTGDRHYAELIAYQPENCYGLYEFTSSPLTSQVRNISKTSEYTNPYRIPNTLVMDNNFGRVSVSGKPGKRTVTMETIDRRGKRVWTYKIPEEELKFSEKTNSKKDE